MSTEAMRITMRRRPPQPGFRRSLSELSGSLGDLGTLIPIAAALIYVNHIDPSALLSTFGLFFILDGLVFKIPIPIQPMKAIAALSISKGYGHGAIAASGILTGLAILLVSITGPLDKVQRMVPRPVVRGIQLALGISLVAAGLRMLSGLPPLGPNSLLLAALSAALIVFSLKRLFPSALILSVVGLILALLINPALMSQAMFQLWSPTLTLPSLKDFELGLDLAFSQIPLTLTNSLLATFAFLKDRYPWRAPDIRSLGLSVGLMSVSAPLIGGVGMCHGAGGVAGWYRFGARSGGSMVIFGSMLTALGIFAGGFIAGVMKVFPLSILGVMLIFVGLELSYQARDTLKSRGGLLIVASTAVTGYLLNILVGVAVGFAFTYALRLLKDRLEAS